MPGKTKRDRPWTDDERELVADLMAKNYGPADIAANLIMRTRVEVNGMMYRLRHPKGGPEIYEEVSHVGWPIPDPRKANDWPDFGTQNVRLPPSNPRYMQPPIRHSSGVASYG